MKIQLSQSLVLSLALVLAALLLGTGAVHADELAQARALFNTAAYADNASANEQANAILHRLYAAQPVDPLVLAYLGASESLAGKYAWMPWTKLHHVDDGLAYLDKAQGLPDPAGPGPSGAPAADELRLVAANTYLALPSMFNTHERGIAVAKLLTGKLDSAQWPAGFRGAVCLLAARAAAVSDNAAAARQWLAKARPLVDDFTRVAFKDLEEKLK